MGSYCFNCGQHAHESARSISALFHDAWHIATHVDSRFWQTLYILLLKPGRLTKEYFAEKRARYLPPVRVYLVLSVLFFAFGLATPHKILVVGPTNAVAKLHAEAQLHADAPSKAAADEAAEAGKAPAANKKKRKSILGLSNCDEIHTSFSWLQSSMRQSCERNPEDYEDSVKRAFIANIPKMMFVFVPMMAFSFGQGLTLPNLIAHGIRLAPNYTGVASSIFGFAQLALSAVAVQIMGYVPSKGWQPALWFCAIGAVLSAICVKQLEAAEASRIHA